MNPFRAWSNFWFRPISARPLGLFRIALGIILLMHLALLALESDYWLSDQGIFQGSEAKDFAGPLRLSPLQTYQDPTSIKCFLGATAVIGLLFTIGWRTRWTSILLYLGLLSIQQRNLESHGGPDSILILLLFYAMLSPCGAAFSLDARRKAKARGTLAEPIIVPWAQRLIQVQVAIIYFDTAILKCNGSTWLDGTALHYVLTNGEFSRIPQTFLTNYPLVINALTFGALLTEFSLAAFLWFRATRPLAILAGLMLHLGILATMNINLFGEAMVSSYLVFLGPEELQKLARPFQMLFRRKAVESEPSRTERPYRVDHGESIRGPHDRELSTLATEAQTL